MADIAATLLEDALDSDNRLGSTDTIYLTDRKRDVLLFAVYDVENRAKAALSAYAALLERKAVQA